MANTLIHFREWEDARPYLIQFAREQSQHDNPIKWFGGHVNPRVCDYWYSRMDDEEWVEYNFSIALDDDGHVLSFVPSFIELDVRKRDAGFSFNEQMRYGDWNMAVVNAIVGWRFLRAMSTQPDLDRFATHSVMDFLAAGTPFCADDLSPLEFRNYPLSNRFFSTLEANWFALAPTFEQYVASLDKDGRADCRAIGRRNAEAGTRVIVSNDFPTADEYQPLLDAYLEYWQQKDLEEIAKYEASGTVINKESFKSARHSETVFNMLRITAQECPASVITTRVYVDDKLVGINLGTEQSGFYNDFKVFNDHIFLRYIDEKLNRLVLGKYVVWENIRHLSEVHTYRRSYLYNLSCGMQPYKSSFIPKDQKSSVYLPSKASPVTAADHLFASFVPPFFYRGSVINNREEMWRAHQEAKNDSYISRLAEITRKVYKRPSFDLTHDEFIAKGTDRVSERALYDDPDKQFDPKGRSHA